VSPGHQKAKNGIRVRQIDFSFTNSDIPRYWLHESMLATHITSALNMILPSGEQFFVRSVKHYEDQIEDPQLQDEIKGFCGQEGSHAREHDRFFEYLESQGYHTKGFSKIYQFLAYRVLASCLPWSIHLAVTVALEHFTAIFAAATLSKPHLDQVHPVMRDLWRWHAAEELEHKAVAFDVLKTVNDSYLVRMMGLLIAILTLGGFLILGTIMLVAQEDRGFRRALSALLTGVKERRVPDEGMRGAFRAYLRRDFHPNDIDNRHLAEAFFEQLDRASL
jgi:predicted metal-dependent hydrolase